MSQRFRRRHHPRLERLEDRVTPVGNILVSTTNGSVEALKEITPAGALVRTMTLPSPADAPDIIVAPDGDIYLYNGTFSPQLTMYSAETGLWSSRTTADWSTANNISYGGVACWGDYVFVTDMTTASESSPSNGLIRFNLADGSVERYDVGHDLIQLTMGLNGRLYTLQDQTGVGSPVRAYDPVTMQQVMSVNLNLPDPRGIAVAANGDIYVANWDRSIVHMDPVGNKLASIALTGPNLGVVNVSDINVSTDGTLVVGTRNNLVVLMDSELTNISYLTVGNQL